MLRMEQFEQAFEGYASSEREPIERQITATDKKIDELVYQLGVYPALGGRLTEEEIRIVEGKEER